MCSSGGYKAGGTPTNPANDFTSKMWTDIRKEIERARKVLELSPEQFRPLGLGEWPAVEKRMYLEFTVQTGKLARWS